MSVIGILFEKRIMDDSGFPRTPDRPVELLGTRVRYPRSVKTTIGACGPNSLGGSATTGEAGFVLGIPLQLDRNRFESPSLPDSENLT